MKLWFGLFLLLALGCQKQGHLFADLGELPPTPPLSNGQRWAVVQSAALLLRAEPAPQAEVIAVMNRAQLLEIQELKILASGDWCRVVYRAEAKNLTGWLPAGGLIILANELEAQMTALRLANEKLG